MSVSEDLSRSIELARDAARLAGVETSGQSMRIDGGDDDHQRRNISYAFELVGVKDAPQLADIEVALEEIPGVTTRMVYPTSMAWITAPSDVHPEQLENIIRAFGVDPVMTDTTLQRQALLKDAVEPRSPRKSTRGMSVRIRRRRRDAQASLSAARDAGFVRRARTRSSSNDVLFTARDLVTPARLITAVVLSLPVIVLSYSPAVQFPGWQWLCLALTTPVAFWCALPFHRAMAGGVRRGLSALDGASSVAVLAAYLWSVVALLFTPAGEIGWVSATGWTPTRRGDAMDLFLDVACGVTALLLVGRFYAKRAGASLVDQMAQFTPPSDTEYKVIRRGHGDEEVLPLSEINRGDDVEVGAGQTIPVDGEVVGGSAHLDHVLVGVDAEPNVKVGDEVAAGTVVDRGKIKVRARRTGHATKWAWVSRWVEEASRRENAATMVSTRSAGMMIPAAYALAVIDFGLWWLIDGNINAAFSTALAILAVVAPVALAISPALAIRHGVEAAARHAILVRDGATLRKCEEVDTVVFNRVGTLVEPEMTVETVTAAEGEDTEVVLLVAAALLVESNHPSSRAIVAAAREAKGHGAPWRVDLEESTIHQDGTTTGRVTLRPVVDGRAADDDEVTYLDAELWRPTNLSRLKGRLALAAVSGGAPIVVRWKNRDRGVITLHDPEKQDAADAVDRLEAMGTSTVMLTRDTYAVGRRFANMLGMSSVLAGVTAHDKAGAVRQLHSRGANVAMVGSLSVLDVIEVGDLGVLYAEEDFFESNMKKNTELEIDALVMRDDVMAVPQLLEHGRRVSRIIDSNMAFALIYNAAAVALAMSGVLPPMGATLVMLGSSLIIGQRSSRAGRFPS
ncbi:metal-transporting ATPase [Corynebacterium sp. HMSC30G07]|uniref:heavy metal translocating P-type ATPase n=1 Tax=Corynebacterium sp. HMSC30G07 TaxID=1581072 RepID=UPI0008A1ACC8|nr:HAD family hydrolase [Corynebacterium sp. HMSC30G07]OFT75447.1 metal-transporting ATPase [Corynebacterium sp. HMSC30G07]